MELEVCPTCGTALSKENSRCERCERRQQLSRYKRKILIFHVLLALLAASLLAGAQITYRTILSNSYQPAQCRTLDEQISTSTSGHTASIDIDVTYDLTTERGQHITGSSRLSTSDFNDAENMKSVYQVGNTYDCWYSTLRPVHARILQEDTPYLFPVILFIICLPFFLMVFYPFYVYIYQSMRLTKKGVQTQGTVIEQERGPKEQTSLVRFQAKTDPPVEYQALIPGRYKANRHLPLIYDPTHPPFSVQVDDKSSKYVRNFYLMVAKIWVVFFSTILVGLALVGFFVM